jgi:hypothetical protein
MGSDIGSGGAALVELDADNNAEIKSLNIALSGMAGPDTNDIGLVGSADSTGEGVGVCEETTDGSSSDNGEGAFRGELTLPISVR